MRWKLFSAQCSNITSCFTILYPKSISCRFRPKRNSVQQVVSTYMEQGKPGCIWLHIWPFINHSAFTRRTKRKTFMDDIINIVDLWVFKHVIRGLRGDVYCVRIRKKTNHNFSSCKLCVLAVFPNRQYFPFFLRLFVYKYVFLFILPFSFLWCVNSHQCERTCKPYILYIPPQ